MADMPLGFEALFEATDSDAWRDLMAQGEQSAPIKRGLDPGIYAALFTSELGQKVLIDMYNRYVNLTRAVPGQGAESAFYREGMAQVVFDIADQIRLAHEGDETDG